MPNLKIDKPWGYEIILTEPDASYTAKLLFIKANQEISLQYHDQKTETLTLFSGECHIIIGQKVGSLTENNMEPHTGYSIFPNTIHQIKAISDCTIFEASTPEIGTTCRLKDKYGRRDESQEVRNLERQNEEY